MILFIVLAGFIFRLAMLLSVKSLWGDEMYSIDFALNRTAAGIMDFCLQTNHPPLYYFFLNWVTRLLGQSEAVLRLLSAVPGALTVWLIYRLTKKIAGKPAAFYASLLAAASPYLLQMSNEIRAYSVVAFLSALTVYFMMKSLKKNKYVPYYVITCALLPYTEHMGVFLITGTAAYLLFTRRKKMIKPVFVVLAMQIPWALLVAYQAVFQEQVFQPNKLIEYRNALWILKKGIGIFWQMVCGYQFSMLTVPNIAVKLKTSVFFWLHACVTGMAMLVLIHASVSAFKKAKDGFYLFLFIFLVPLGLLLAFYPIRLSARYISFSAPVFFMMLGYGFSLIKPRPLKTLGLALLLALNVRVGLDMVNSRTDAMHREDFRSMVQYVAGQSDAHTIIVDSEPFYQYYTRRLSLKNIPLSYAAVKRLAPANLEHVKKIWVMREINMDAEITDRMIREDSAILRPFGFKEKQRVRFGGEEGLTMAVEYGLFEAGSGDKTPAV